MESRKVPGLFLVGELLDVDGVTGGFNFQHCWTSGWLAGCAIAASGDSELT
jgi:predicted flavoprotein YhiN